MATLIAYHDVEDVLHWLASEVRAQAFASVGATVRTFVDTKGGNTVGLLVEAPDVDALMAMLSSPEAAEAMATDRVHPETLVMLAEA